MKRGIINPFLGVTDANLRTQIRSALRKVWRNSSRRRFIESIRFPYKGLSGRGRYGVKCAVCERIMGQSECEFATLKSGKLSKKKSLVYQIDHVEMNHELLDIRKDLGEYANTLLYGEMRVLCVDCHKVVTAKQKE